MTDQAAPKPISAHIRDLMRRRRWSERDLAVRINDGRGISHACALVRILLSTLDTSLSHDTATLLARASNEAPHAWIEREEAWRAAQRAGNDNRR